MLHSLTLFGKVQVHLLDAMSFRSVVILDLRITLIGRFHDSGRPEVSIHFKDKKCKRPLLKLNVYGIK